MGRPKGSKNKINRRIKITCSICKKEFDIPYFRKDNAKFCSYKCYWNSLKGTHQTPESNKKRSNSLKGEKGSGWKGGVSFNNGYKYIFNPKHPFRSNRGYIAEHRIVMEKYLGRYLTNNEIVHHINGKKTDNRIDNLMLFPTNTAHLAYHRFSHSDASPQHSDPLLIA